MCDIGFIEILCALWIKTAWFGSLESWVTLCKTAMPGFSRHFPSHVECNGTKIKRVQWLGCCSTVIDPINEDSFLGGCEELSV